MKKLSVFCVLLAGIMAALPALAAKDSPLKIGIIDTQKIIRDAKAAKSAGAAFQKERESKQATLEAKGKDVRNIEEQLKKADKNAAPKLRDELAKEVKEFNRLKSDLEEELKKKEIELTQKVVGEIRQIVQDLSKKEDYSLIMEKGSVVTSSDAIDITDKIIKLYDAQKK